MSKVLFLAERDMGTSSILKDMFDGNFKPLAETTPDDINSYDVIFLIRPSDILSASIAKRAKQSGRFVITFYDDDLLNYMRVPTWGRYAARKTLSYSDVMLSFNSHLCEKYLKYIRTKRAVRIDMSVKEKQINKYVPVKNEKIKIVYAASTDHAELFNDIVRPALPEIIEKYGDKISLTFVGVDPELKNLSDKLEINYIKLMPLLEYRNFMAEQKFDVGLAPLYKNEFTRCKYFNKYIEYSMSGIFGIYSDVEPYTFAVKNGENGILAKNTREDWIKALENAITNKELRVKGIQNAQEDLRKNFNRKKIMSDLEKDIPEIFNFEGRRENCKSFGFTKFVYSHMTPLEVLYRVIYRICHYLNQGGIKLLFIRSVEHFKRKKGK